MVEYEITKRFYNDSMMVWYDYLWTNIQHRRTVLPLVGGTIMAHYKETWCRNGKRHREDGHAYQ